MIFINPKILVYDISFQLSFLATLGIIYVSPIIKEKLISIPEKYNFREMLSSTLAAQITVLPLILYTMGIFSLVALPVNILILLFIPLIMLLGFITGMVSLLSITLAKPFAWISFILLAYVTNLADFFSKIPYAAVVIKTFPSIFMIILYSILIFWILKEKGKFN
jgi:competence protein ComEC